MAVKNIKIAKGQNGIYRIGWLAVGGGRLKLGSWTPEQHHSATRKCIY